jgi:hypothetical protein
MRALLRSVVLAALVAAPVMAQAPGTPDAAGAKAAKPAVKAGAKLAKPAKPAAKPAVKAKVVKKGDDAVATVDAAAAPAPEATAAVDSAATAHADAVAVPAATAQAVEAPTPAAPVLPAAPPSAPVSEESALVAVLDLKGGAAAAAQASALTTMLTAEVSATKGMRAVSRNELQALLTHQSTAQLVGCDEPKCMADVAALVKADFVVSGSVEKLEGATVVGLTLMSAGGDGQDPAIVARQKAAWRGTDNDLLLVVRPLVQRLFDAQNAHTHVGAAEVFAPEGATLVLDDKAIGTAPVAAIRDLPTGVHRLMVQKDGFADEAVDLVVARNETTIVRVELEEIPLLSQPWFWATAGGVVLLAGGTAAGITTYAILNAEPPPSRVVLGKEP